MTTTSLDPLGVVSTVIAVVAIVALASPAVRNYDIESHLPAPGGAG